MAHESPAPETSERLDAPDVLEAVRAWLPERRWFPTTADATSVVRVSRTDLGTDEHGAHAVVDLLRVAGTSSSSPLTLQVPLVLEPAGTPPAAVDARGLVAVLSDGSRLLDGAYHPAFVSAWLERATWAEGSGAVPVAGEASRSAFSPARFDVRGLHVLTGEQSNTSILLPSVSGGSMLKVIRALAPGQNPDIVVPLALTREGWGGVPAPYAWSETAVDEGAVVGGGPAAGENAAAAPTALPRAWTTHTGVLAELVPQARDGFELACDFAREGQPFANPARELGTQVAQMHSALRRAFASEVHEADPEWLLDAMHRRVRSAAGASTAVRSRVDQIEAFLEHMRGVAEEAVRQGRPLPPVQRIHGDLHLGQALYSPQKGWRILDFEGEPLRPLAERTRPDLGERDVAGMLRSFDYASAVGGATSSEWARSARRAFLEGYTGYLSVPGALGFGRPPSLADRVLIRDAFELDKALYEVVYEERNRPSWISIPLDAVDRVLSGLPAPLTSADAGRTGRGA